MVSRQMTWHVTYLPCFLLRTSKAKDAWLQVSDVLLAEVALGCRQLQSISLSNCSAVTDAGVRGLAAGCPALLAFVADDVGRLTDGALLALGDSCKRLQVRVLTTAPAEQLQSQADGTEARHCRILREPLKCFSVILSVVRPGSLKRSLQDPLMSQLAGIAASLTTPRPLKWGILFLACRPQYMSIAAVEDFVLIPLVMLVQVASLRRCTKISNVGLAALTLSGSLRSLNVSGIAAAGPPLMKALADSCS